MGYSSANLPEEGVCVGASFNTISGEKIDLVDLIVTGYEGEVSDEPIEIQTLKGSGSSDRTFKWYDYWEGEDHIVGWFEPDADFAQLERGDVTLFPGEGLWLISNADNFGLQSSGQVPTDKDIVTPLPEEGLTVVNPTPVNADAAKVYVSNYEGEISDEPIELQTLKPSGSSDRTFKWYDYWEGDDHVIGWFEPDADFALLEEGDIVLTPGLGLWVISATDEFTLCWPKVELAK